VTHSENGKLLGFWDLLSISVGQVVGAGVVILTGIGISITGYGTPWAFLLALAIVALPTISIAALGSAVPSTGGNYTYVRDLIGPKTGVVYLGLLVAGQMVLATYALGFADYADALLPGINMTVVAGCVMTLCYVANLLGVKTAARLQSLMVLVLITSLLMFIVFGFPHVETYEPYLSKETVMPSGVSAFIVAAFVLRYSMVGSEFISELGGESKNPGKNIPRVMLISLALVTVLYIAISIIATGVLPIDEVENKSLAFVAKEIFPPTLYVFFVAGGVMLALVTSLNSVFAWCTKGLYIATNDGWLPHGVAKTNRFGTPFLLLTVFYAVGMLPIVTGMTLEYVTLLGNAVGIIFGIIPVLALYNLYDRRRDAWEAASFRLSRSAMKIVPVLAALIYTYGIYLNRDFLGAEAFTTLFVYTGLLIAYAFWRERRNASS
jgi:APA family basic amino acid/polyamine antiporter